MTTFLDYIRRLLVIMLGFLAAIFSGGIVFSIGLFNLFDAGQPSTDAATHLFELAGFAVMVSATAGSIILVPFVVLAGLAELFSWQHILLHGVFGGLTGAAATALWSSSGDPDGLSAVMAGAAAGICGASIYWLIAGRNNGKLFERIVASRSA